MGHIKDNKKEGYGEMMTEDTFYEGEWKNDIEEGIGMKTDKFSK